MNMCGQKNNGQHIDANIQRSTMKWENIIKDKF